MPLMFAVGAAVGRDELLDRVNASGEVVVGAKHSVGELRDSVLLHNFAVLVLLVRSPLNDSLVLSLPLLCGNGQFESVGFGTPDDDAVEIRVAMAIDRAEQSGDGVVAGFLHLGEATKQRFSGCDGVRRRFLALTAATLAPVHK